MTAALGFDFGTTNSAMALAGPDRRARVTRTFRSILHFDREERGRDRRPLATVGPAAIARYVDGAEGRLIQSLKSYLGSRTFRATSIFGVTYTLEDLVARLVRGLRELAEAELGPLGGRVVVGRPVRFAGDDEIQAEALERLRRAVLAGGFDEVVFEYEPVAAAYHYESGLCERGGRDELVLVADFGGGTSDFCLVRVGPGVRARGRTAADILGTEGVAVAGDAFDGRVVRNQVAPALGKGTSYVIDGKAMPVPPWLYGHVERWHHLSFLKSRETAKLLGDIADGARAPEKIRALEHLVEDELGYALALAVQRTKVALSSAPTAPLSFRDEPIAIEAELARAAFEGWIAEELTAIAGCVDRLLARTGVAPGEVDRVFMTGGSSQVPAVRAIFAARFGQEKLGGGDELTSVASGLALRALDYFQSAT